MASGNKSGSGQAGSGDKPNQPTAPDADTNPTGQDDSGTTPKNSATPSETQKADNVADGNPDVDGAERRDDSDELADPSKTYISYNDPDSDSDELTRVSVEDYQEKGLDS